jgi:hypothetical protein
MLRHAYFYMKGCDLNRSTQHSQRTSLLGFDIARSCEGTLRGATIRLGRLSFALWHGPTRQLNIPRQFRQDLVHNLCRKFCYLTGIVSVSFAGVRGSGNVKQKRREDCCRWPLRGCNGKRWWRIHLRRRRNCQRPFRRLRLGSGLTTRI